MIVWPHPDGYGSDRDDRDGAKNRGSRPSLLTPSRTCVDAFNRIGRDRNTEPTRTEDVTEPALELVVRRLLAHRPTPSVVGPPSDSANWAASRRNAASARDAWLFTVPTDDPINAAICASDWSS
jgi:hypothetical protein